MNTALYSAADYDNHSIHGLENDGFSMADEGCISDLPDKAFLKIFSFMSLIDRGQLASVCKRWSKIMKDSRLWTFINFWQPNACLHNPWTDEKHVFRLLETYADSGLKTIHLKVIGTDTLLFLHQYCPNIEVLSFWPPTLPRILGLDSKFRPVPHFSKNVSIDLMDSLHIPKSARRIQLAFMGVEAPYGGSFVEFECGGFTHALMCKLSCCRQLRHVTLVHCDGITKQGLMTLTENVPELEELWLLNFRHRATKKDTLAAILRCIAQNLTKLKSFRFITAKLDVNFDEFFRIVGNHGMLQQLWIGRGPYSFSEKAFAELCRNLPSLEELVLEYCDCVTDTVIECIGGKLRNLKLLNLLASGPYTMESVTYLQDHPTLQITNVPGINDNNNSKT